MFVAYDQLSDRLGPLATTPPDELGIVLVEAPARARRRPYHRQKLALVLTDLRHLALEEGHAHRAARADHPGALDPGALPASAADAAALWRHALAACLPVRTRGWTGRTSRATTTRMVMPLASLRRRSVGERAADAEVFATVSATLAAGKPLA